MKSKALITTLAATLAGVLAMVSTGQQAEAGRSGSPKDGGRPPGVTDIRVDHARRSSETDVTRATPEVQVRELMTSVARTKMGAELNANRRTRLTRKLANPENVKIVEEIVALEGKFPELAAVLLRNFVYVKNISIGAEQTPAEKALHIDAKQKKSSEAKSEAERAELEKAELIETHATLVVAGVKKASNWTPETRSNLEFLLKKTAEFLEAGESTHEAMRKGMEELAKPEAQGGRAVFLNTAAINELCK